MAYQDDKNLNGRINDLLDQQLDLKSNIYPFVADNVNSVNQAKLDKVETELRKLASRHPMNYSTVIESCNMSLYDC